MGHETDRHKDKKQLAKKGILIYYYYDIFVLYTNMSDDLKRNMVCLLVEAKKLKQNDKDETYKNLGREILYVLYIKRYT